MKMERLENFADRLEKLGADVRELRDVSVIDNAFKFLPLAKPMLCGLPASEELDELQDELEYMRSLLKI
jgi:hypothetical protein